MSFLSKSILNVAGSATFAILNLIVGVTLARLLTPHEMGQFSIAISAATIFAAFFGLELGGSLIYFINKHKIDKNKVYTIVLKLSALLGLGLILPYMLLLNYQEYFGEMSIYSKLAIAIYTAALLMQQNLSALLIASLEVHKHLLVSLLPHIVTLLIIGVSYTFNTFSVAAAWTYFAIGQTSGLILLLWMTRQYIKPHISFVDSTTKSICQFGLKLNLSFVLLVLTSELGIFMVQHYTNDFSETAYFRLAIRLGGAILLISGALGPLLYSKWASVDIAQKRIEVEKVSRVFWAFSFILVCILEIGSYEIIVLLYGEEYSPAATILQIVLIGAWSRFLITPILRILSSSGEPLIISYLHLTNLILIVILMVMLVPEDGAIGAAIAFAISNLITLVVAYTVGKIRFGIRVHKCFLITLDDILQIKNTLLSKQN